MAAIVPEKHVALLQKWGKFQDVLEPGLHLYNPLTSGLKRVKWTFFEEEISTKRGVVRTRSMYYIPIAEQVYDIPPVSVVFNDNLEASINGIMSFRIVDPIKAVFDMVDMPWALSVFANQTITDLCSALSSSAFIQNKQQHQVSIREEMKKREEAYGVELIVFSIQEIRFSDAVRQNLQKIQAEKIRAMQELEAEKRQMEVEKLNAERQLQLQAKRIEREKLEQEAEIQYQRLRDEKSVLMAECQLKIQKLEAGNQLECAKLEAQAIKAKTSAEQEWMKIAQEVGIESSDIAQMFRARELRLAMEKASHSFIPLESNVFFNTRNSSNDRNSTPTISSQLQVASQEE